MYKNLSETIDSEENNAQVNAIKDKLANLMEEFKNSPTSDADIIINRNNMQEIVKRILEFNQLNQSGKCFNNLEKLKNEIRQPLYSLYRSKKLKKQIYKSLIDII